MLPSSARRPSTAASTSWSTTPGIDVMLPVPGGNDSTVHEVFDVNFFATVSGTLAVVPGMVERGWGVVVNVSSDTVRAPEPRQGAYAASKAAVSAFSECVAHEIGRPAACTSTSSTRAGCPRPWGCRATRTAVPCLRSWCVAPLPRSPTLTAERMGGPRIDINAARLPLLAPIARTLAPLSYQRAMRRLATT